jgi:ribonuclease P protein component
MTDSRPPQKLRSRRQFRAVYAQGQKFHTPFFSAFILRTEGAEQRFGITATRKIGGAVLRNRCKRRLREIIRHCHVAELDGIGFDLVVNPKTELATADFRQLREAFERTLKRFRATLPQAKAEQAEAK